MGPLLATPGGPRLAYAMTNLVFSQETRAHSQWLAPLTPPLGANWPRLTLMVRHRMPPDQQDLKAPCKYAEDAVEGASSEASTFA